MMVSKKKKAAKKAKRRNARAGQPVTDRPFREPPKAKQVTGDKVKLKKLGELKQVQKKIDAQFKEDDKKFRARDKLFDQKRKLEQQLGIDR